MKKTKKYGENIDSVESWEKLACEYASSLENSYHGHRLKTIMDLIPENLFENAKQIFDFGCGDAILFKPFLLRGAKIEGCDPSVEMIELGKKRLLANGYDSNILHIGGVEVFEKIPSGSLDAILSFNVIAYMSDNEEKKFYKEALRLLRTGGWLIVTHSNNLFDLFSANRLTIDFLKKYLVSDTQVHSKLETLFTYSKAPEGRTEYNIRENPISYPAKLESKGFSVKKTNFINLHAAPPVLKSQNSYPDTLLINPEDRWKLNFTCSTFGVAAQKV